MWFSKWDRERNKTHTFLSYKSREQSAKRIYIRAARQNENEMVKQKTTENIFEQSWEKSVKKKKKKKKEKFIKWKVYII